MQKRQSSSLLARLRRRRWSFFANASSSGSDCAALHLWQSKRVSIGMEYVLWSKYRGYKCEIRLGNVICCCVRILWLCVRCRGRTLLCAGVEATVKKRCVREGAGASLCKTTTLFHSLAQRTSWFAPWGFNYKQLIISTSLLIWCLSSACINIVFFELRLRCV